MKINDIDFTIQKNYISNGEIFTVESHGYGGCSLVHSDSKKHITEIYPISTILELNFEEFKLSWRDVYDCKVSGESFESTQVKASEGFYKYFCHNDRIHRVNCGTKICNSRNVIG